MFDFLKVQFMLLPISFEHLIVEKFIHSNKYVISLMAQTQYRNMDKVCEGIFP